jgi:hypothetical protein
MATPKKDQKAEAQADAEEQDSGQRVRGFEALSPTDQKSASQTSPRLTRTDVSNAESTADEVASESERTGSVLPYKVDDIDVDSYDVRTPQEIQEQREKEGENT